MKVIYKDIAPGAAEDAEFSSASLMTMSQIDRLTEDLEMPLISTLEENGWPLDGSTALLSGANQGGIVVWSTALSDGETVFSTPPEIDIEFDNQYSSLGITLRFSQRIEDICSEVELIWYREGTEIARQTFYPDEASYYCESRVEAYDKVTVRFLKTWLPYKRMRLEFVGFGIMRTYGDSELSEGSLSTIQQIDPTMGSIPANTFDWELRSASHVEYLFQFKQAIEVWGDSFIGVYYVDDSTRHSKTRYSIKCTDAVGVLETDFFEGGVYTNYDAETLIREICGGFIVYWDEALAGRTVSGYIQPGTKRRDALKMVCQALCAVADTAKSDGIKVFPLKKENLRQIGGERTYYGTTIKTAAAVTAVKVIGYTYTEGTPGNNDKYITVGDKTYIYTETEYTARNPLATASDKANIKEYKNTMIRDSDAQAVADYMLARHMERQSHNVSFILNDEDTLGDYAESTTDFGATHTGFITKMTIKLGGLTRADSIVTGEAAI